MRIVIVSECQGASKARSERILDLCLDRMGGGAWRGRLTEVGLHALRMALLAAASSETSVAAHLVKGAKDLELLWIVGSSANYHPNGDRAISGPAEDPNLVTGVVRPDSLAWMILVIRLAGLWHDVGKANAEFAPKLAKRLIEPDTVRHEILSTLAFLRTVSRLTISGDNSPAAVRSAIDASLKETFNFDAITDRIDITPTHLPMELRHAAWLIASNHRLPMAIKALEPVDDAGTFTIADHVNPEKFKKPVSISLDPRVITPMLVETTSELLTALAARRPASIPDWRIITGYGRLALILADHEVSMADIDPAFHSGPLPARGVLMANDKQTLDEHLLKVSDAAGRSLQELFAGANTFPALTSIGLPRVIRERSTGRHAWQTDIVSLIESDTSARAEGFFGVLAAGPGAGKTRAAIKIMASLSGAVRYTLALSQRALTLQAGDEYRRELTLGGPEVTTIVGDSAAPDHPRDDPASSYNRPLSHSVTLDETYSADQKGDLFEIPDFLKKHVVNDPVAERLFCAPIALVTVDHIMAAADMRRSSYIIHALRLLSADLILDDVDNFDAQDLVAIGRLVHLAGIFGRKVQLSSATIPPVVAEGFFQAYLRGWQAHADFFQKSPSVKVGFFSDHPASNILSSTQTTEEYGDLTHRFYAGLVHAHVQQPHLRQAQMLPKVADKPALFAQITAQIEGFHRAHHVRDRQTRKRFTSVLVRFAHIQSCVEYARRLSQDLPDADIRTVVYHSQYPLLVLTEIETFLAAVLRRGERPISNEPRLASWIAKSQKKDLILIVIASPIEDAGRDHDFDAAILEPTSTSSMIRGAGLVNRHRRREITSPNVAIMAQPVCALTLDARTHYSKPGVEADNTPIDQRYILSSPNIADLVVHDDCASISAVPRLKASGHGELANLEHVKNSDFLFGSHYLSLENYGSDQTRAFLASTHATEMSFRDSRPDFQLYFHPGFEAFVHFSNEKSANTIVEVKQSSTSNIPTLLNLDPKTLLNTRLENPADHEAAGLEAKRYMRMNLRAGEHFVYENDLGAFLEP